MRRDRKKPRMRKERLQDGVGCSASPEGTYPTAVAWDKANVGKRAVTIILGLVGSCSGRGTVALRFHLE